MVSIRPWHGSAQDTKGRVNHVPPLQLRGWKEEKGRHTQKEWLFCGALPPPQCSEALTQRQTEGGRLGPTQLVRTALGEWKKMLVIMTIGLSHHDVIGSLQQPGVGDRTGNPSPISQMSTLKPRKIECLNKFP